MATFAPMISNMKKLCMKRRSHISGLKWSGININYIYYCGSFAYVHYKKHTWSVANQQHMNNQDKIMKAQFMIPAYGPTFLAINQIS